MLVGIPSAPTTPPEPLADAAAPPNLFVVVLYYIPLLFASMVFVLMTEFRFSGIAVGAVAMFGTVLSALGLIVGSVHLRTDFLKGFFIHAAVGSLVAVLFFVLSAWFDLFGDVDGNVRMLVLSTLPALYFPPRYHVKQQHRQALGAAYAAPLVFMLVFFGLLFGWYATYGSV